MSVVVSKATIMGYIGTTDPDILNKFSNIIESLFHKQEGKIVKTITEANDKVTITFSDDSQKIFYTSQFIDTLIAAINENPVDGWIFVKTKAQLLALTGNTTKGYFVLKDDVSDANNGSYGFDGSVFYQGYKLPEVEKIALNPANNERIVTGKVVADWVDAKITTETTARNNLALVVDKKIQADIVVSNQIYDKNAQPHLNGKFVSQPNGGISTNASYEVVKFNLIENQNIFLTNFFANNPFSVAFMNSNDAIISAVQKNGFANFFTGVANCSYILVTIDKTLKNTAIASYGNTSIPYEVYKTAIDNDLIQKSSSYIDDVNNPKKTLPITSETLKDFENKKNIGSKADLEISGTNLFNKDVAKIQFVAGQEQQVDNFGDTILVNALTTGFNYSTWELIYTSFNINLSPKIYLTDEKPIAKLNENVTTQTVVLYFNEFGRIIHKVNSTNIADKTVVVDVTNGKVSYVRFSYTKNTENSVMINYGSTSLSYVSYDANKYLKETQIPKILVKKDELELEIDNKIISVFGSIPKLSLPSKMYFLKNNNALVYLKGIIHNNILKTNYDIIFSNISLTKKVDDLIIIITTTTSTVSNIIALYAINSLLDSKTVSFEIVDPPVTPKILNFWNTGDSITDLNTYQPEIKRLLALDNITANFIGLMPNSDDTIYSDPLSGGNLGFISEQGTESMVVDVTNVIERPKTGFPGTQYQDTNGNVWVCRGYKLTESAGTYSGKIKLGIFITDPNYADGGVSGTTPTGGFPANSTLTKTNALPGDSIINYTTVDTVNFNPYWNPNTNEIDFSWYQSYWGLATPNVFLMQWSYNDVGGDYEEIDGTKITLAMSRAKSVIDKFLSQYPNAKVVFGTDPYGTEIPTFWGGSISNSARKYSTINFFRALVNTFDNVTYENKVYLIPVHAQFDHATGYGATSTEIITVDGITYNVKKLNNGFDGVHPSVNTEGWKYEAKAYRAVLNKIANTL